MEKVRVEQVSSTYRMKMALTLILMLTLIKVCSSQTYLFHEPDILNDSLRTAILNDPSNSIYPIQQRPCTIFGNVLDKDSTYCLVTDNIFNPTLVPCGIQNLYTFDCYDSLNRTVFGSFISQGKYRGNYIIHYPSGYVHVIMTLDKNGISGPVYHYYDISTDTYVGKTYDKGSLMVELAYKNNLIWNVKKLLDKNGKSLKQGNFKNGNGTLNLYRENGTLLRTIEVKNGSLNGICTYYYSTGQVLMQGKYLNDLQEGVWNEYDIFGKIITQPEYRKGEVISWD
jgi:antitoxin component YwqK of YwqJK toxin-antitoxin module